MLLPTIVFQVITECSATKRNNGQVGAAMVGPVCNRTRRSAARTRDSGKRPRAPVVLDFDDEGGY